MNLEFGRREKGLAIEGGLSRIFFCAELTTSTVPSSPVIINNKQLLFGSFKNAWTSIINNKQC